MTLRKKLLLASALAGSMTLSGSVLAGPNPFKDCGIGAALFSDTHWAAVISNVIWDLGTTAVTSATASPETCSGSDVKTAQFILENYDNLAEETAKGSGDHLTAMLNVLGCESNSHSAIVSSIRSEMADKVSNPTYSQESVLGKASDLYDIVNTNASVKFSGSCSV